jgi:hypothetical protein
MAGLAALKNFITLYLTPNNELNIELIQSMSPENIKNIQRKTQLLIDRFEMEPSSENVDMKMYLDQLYKIRNALDLHMRNIPASGANVAYGGIRYKRQSKRRSSRRNKRSKRHNKRNKRSSRRR